MENIEELLSYVCIALFIEVWLSFPIGIVIGKLFDKLILKSGVSWPRVRSSLITSYGEDFMMKISKKNIYKKVKEKRKKFNFLKTLFLLLIILKGVLPLFFQPSHRSYDSAYTEILGFNTLSTFIYFIFWFKISINDKKTNGDSISILKNIKKNLFNVYIGENTIDI